MDLLTEFTLNMLAAESRKQTRNLRARHALVFRSKGQLISILVQLARDAKGAPQSPATKTSQMPPTALES